MRLEDIHIGDVLQVRDWDDMALEFGEKDGFQGRVVLTSPAVFIPSMRYLCGRVFTVSNINEKGFISSVEGCELSLSGKFQSKRLDYNSSDASAPRPRGSRRRLRACRPVWLFDVR